MGERYGFERKYSADHRHITAFRTMSKRVLKVRVLHTWDIALKKLLRLESPNLPFEVGKDY